MRSIRKNLLNEMTSIGKPISAPKKQLIINLFPPWYERRCAWKIGKRCQSPGSRAKYLASRRVYRELYENEDGLETGEEAVINKDWIQYRVLKELFSAIENRNFSLFHFCATGNLVYMLTLSGLLRLIHMIVAKEW